MNVVSQSNVHLTASSIKKLENNVKRSLNSSVRSENTEFAAKQVENIMNTYVNQSNQQNDKVIKRNIIYKNFILQSNIIADATDKEIEELKGLLEDYAKMKDFKTVSLASNKNNIKSDRDIMKKTMKNLLKNVKHSIFDNLNLVEGTLKNVTDSQKKATNYKKTIIKTNQQILKRSEKKHLDTLETEITSLDDLNITLEEIKANLNNNLETLKSFAFKLK